MPMSSATMARLMSMSKSATIREPVQAPVMGKGMPTKRTRPMNSYFSIWPFLRMARLSIRSTRGRKNRVLRMAAKIFLIKKRMKGMGIKLPMALMMIPRHISTSSRLAARMPPRSSRMGNREIIKTRASRETRCPSPLCKNQFTKLSI